MPFSASTGDVDVHGRQIWYCDLCPASTTSEAFIEAHVCPTTELGKTTTDEDADRILATAQDQVAGALDAFRLLGQAETVKHLITVGENRLKAASSARGLAKSERQAGAADGQIRTEQEHLKYLRQVMDVCRADLEKLGWDV